MAINDISNLRDAELNETRLWLSAADRVLKELWDNAEDAVYDEVEYGADHGTRFDDPRDVELSHKGRWIAWDAEERVVLAEGDSMDEVLDVTDDAREAGQLIWYHHILHHDEVIVGGITTELLRPFSSLSQEFAR